MDYKANERELASLREKLTNDTAEVRRLETASAAARAWDTRKADADRRKPVVPPMPSEPPAPTTARPTEEEVASATDTLSAVERAKGAEAQRVQALRTAEAELARVTKEHGLAEAEAARVVALVDACRRAPTQIAREQAEALGDMGCVSLRFPPKETKDTAEIEVLIDGRPWWLASDGRQLVGDLLFRAALRRASGLTSLPLWVDHTTLWSGAWPDVEGPVVFLRTTTDDTEGIEVVSC